jgi:magnesium transporter
MARDARRGLETLARGFLEQYPDEAARELERGSAEEGVGLLAGIPALKAAAVVERLSPDTATRMLGAMDDRTRSTVLSRIEPARGAALLSRLDEPERKRWLQALDPRMSRDLKALSSYSADSPGAMMDPRVVALRPHMTARQALSQLRRFRERKIRRVFVVDEGGRLVGAVPLQDLALAAPGERLEQLVGATPVSIQATAGPEELNEILNRHHVDALPVVDFEGRLLGVIRHDALVEAAREDASADMQTMVGASREERALSRVPFAVRKRLPWLQVNLGTAFLAAAVVGLFEETIARNTALAVLLPVVAGQSGNTGSQALAVTMRGLALREVRTRHWLRVCLKEIRVALINGVAVALTTAFFVYLWSRSPGLALVIGLSMVLSMAAAGLSGAAIPMLLTALGQDPAQSSSIILTTVTDVVGFFSFLGIATLLAAML